MLHRLLVAMMTLSLLHPVIAMEQKHVEKSIHEFMRDLSIQDFAKVIRTNDGKKVTLLIDSSTISHIDITIDVDVSYNSIVKLQTFLNKYRGILFLTKDEAFSDWDKVTAEVYKTDCLQLVQQFHGKLGSILDQLGLGCVKKVIKAKCADCEIIQRCIHDKGCRDFAQMIATFASSSDSNDRLNSARAYIMNHVKVQKSTLYSALDNIGIYRQIYNQDPCWVNGMCRMNDNLIIYSGKEAFLKTWDVQEKQCTRMFHYDETLLQDKLFSLSQKRIACCLSNNNIEIIDMIMNKKLTVFKEHNAFVGALIELSDNMLMSCSEDRTIKVWNATTGKCVKTIENENNEYTNVCLVLLPNGQVASGWDGIINVWDTTTFTCLKTIGAHEKRINALCVLHDGTLASASKDKTIKIWDLNSGVCLRKLNGHQGSVWSLVELSENILASSSHDRTIKMWDKISEHWIYTLPINYIHSTLNTLDSRLIIKDHDKIVSYDVKPLFPVYVYLNTKLTIQEQLLFVLLHDAYVHRNKIVFNEMMQCIYNKLISIELVGDAVKNAYAPWIR